MLTIRPHFALRMSGTTTCVTTNVPRTLMSNICVQSSSVISSKGTIFEMPALLTRIVTGPNASRSASTATFTASRSAMLACSAMALPPAALISATTALQPSMSRSSTPTALPSAASFNAQARPMPAAAPVTNATFIDVPCFVVRREAEVSGGLELQDRLFAMQRCAAHQAVAVERVPVGAVHCAGVVEQEEVALAPLMTIDVFVLGRPLHQTREQQ